ncbi:MAG: hypothetical protein WC150_01105 [Bacteroidia bacterium]
MIKINKTTSLILLLIIGLNKSVFSQNSTSVDTATLKPVIKMLLLQDMQNQHGFKDFSHIVSFLQMPLKMEILKQTGYRSLVFIKIPEQDFFVDTIMTKGKKWIATSRVTAYSTYPNNYFVVAYNTITKKFYRILGFRTNDFEDLYDNVTIWQSGNVAKTAITVSSIKEYLEHNAIEGVNLECLLLSLLQKKTECFRD